MINGQHGFTEGRSTTTATESVQDWINSKPEKHAIGVFLDISGAFDNLK